MHQEAQKEARKCTNDGNFYFTAFHKADIKAREILNRQRVGLRFVAELSLQVGEFVLEHLHAHQNDVLGL